MNRARLPILAASLIVALVGCGTRDHQSSGLPIESPSPSPGATAKASGQNLVEPGYTGRFRVRATVLESPHHGPQLCDAVAQSNPPQCGGPDIVGWDWSTVTADSSYGTTWGFYVVTGTWDRARMRFMLTERPTSYDRNAEPAPTTDDGYFASRCPAPPGGWKPIDPARATEHAMEAAWAIARREPDFAELWLDQSYLKALPPAEVMGSENDPRRYVLNIMFTGDLPRHESQIRAVWGGALCLSRAVRTHAELERISNDIEASLNRQIIRTTEGGPANDVNPLVFVAWADEQRRLDATYGMGTVKLKGWLEPID
jgi:hypothetical protein